MLKKRTKLGLLRLQPVEELFVKLIAWHQVRKHAMMDQIPFEMLDIVRLVLSQLETPAALHDGLVGIVVVDCGVMQWHPLLGPTCVDQCGSTRPSDHCRGDSILSARQPYRVL